MAQNFHSLYRSSVRVTAIFKLGTTVYIDIDVHHNNLIGSISGHSRVIAMATYPTSWSLQDELTASTVSEYTDYKPAKSIQHLSQHDAQHAVLYASMPTTASPTLSSIFSITDHPSLSQLTITVAISDAHTCTVTLGMPETSTPMTITMPATDTGMAALTVAHGTAVTCTIGTACQAIPHSETWATAWSTCWAAGLVADLGVWAVACTSQPRLPTRWAGFIAPGAEAAPSGATLLNSAAMSGTHLQLWKGRIPSPDEPTAAGWSAGGALACPQVQAGPDFQARFLALGLPAGSCMCFTVQPASEGALPASPVPAAHGAAIPSCPSAPTPMQAAVAATKALPFSGFHGPASSLMVTVSRLHIDRAVADVRIALLDAAGMPMQAAAMRSTLPEPAEVVIRHDVTVGIVSVAFTDVWRSKVECPVVELPLLAASPLASTDVLACHLWGGPDPVLSAQDAGVLAWRASRAPSAEPSAATAAASSPAAPALPAGVREEPGTLKPFVCPDGKRFTTASNAGKWVQKRGLAPQPGDELVQDENEVFAALARSEEAAQAEATAHMAAMTGVVYTSSVAVQPLERSA